MTSDEIVADFFNSTVGSRSGGNNAKSRGFITHNMKDKDQGTPTDREQVTLTGVAIKSKVANNPRVRVLRRPSE
jgi:hypothetical protein